MLSTTPTTKLPAAPRGFTADLRLGHEALASGGSSFTAGSNRLPFPATDVAAPRFRFGSGELVAGNGVCGITATGHQAHAAVRMHVDPATGASWLYAQKSTATPSSIGRLRPS